MAFVKVRGVRMSIEERNIEMKMKYITSRVTAEELAEEYNVSVSTIEGIRRRDKWVKARKEFNTNKREAADDTVKQVYAGFKAHIAVQYNSSWQKLMNIVNMALNDPERYLFHSNGEPRWGALEIVANLLEKAQKGQGDANGFIPAELQIKLEIQKDKLLIAREQAGMGEATEVVTDNLIEVLQEAAQAVWADEGIQPPGAPKQIEGIEE